MHTPKGFYKLVIMEEKGKQTLFGVPGFRGIMHMILLLNVDFKRIVIKNPIEFTDD